MRKCACCGGDMILEKETDKLLAFRCQACGLSNTELKSIEK